MSQLDSFSVHKINDDYNNEDSSESKINSRALAHTIKSKYTKKTLSLLYLTKAITNFD